MDNFQIRERNDYIIDNWDWQPNKLKERFGQLTLSDVTLEFGKENDLLSRIGMRLNKSHFQVIYLLKNLRRF